MKITLTPEQIEAINEALSNGESITIESIPKWGPKGGKFLVTDILNHPITSEKIAKNGFSYITRALAEHAAKALRSYARQLAWLAENSDGWEADWSDREQKKYFCII